MSTHPQLKHSTHWPESEAARSIINPEAAVTGAFGNCVKCGKPFFDPNESVYHFPRGPMCGTCFIPPTPAPTLAETGAAFITAIKRAESNIAGMTVEQCQAVCDEITMLIVAIHNAHHPIWEHVERETHIIEIPDGKLPKIVNDVLKDSRGITLSLSVVRSENSTEAKS